MVTLLKRKWFFSIILYALWNPAYHVSLRGPRAELNGGHDPPPQQSPQITSMARVIRTWLGEGPTLVIISYMSNQCSYQHETCSISVQQFTPFCKLNSCLPQLGEECRQAYVTHGLLHEKTCNEKGYQTDISDFRNFETQRSRGTICRNRSIL